MSEARVADYGCAACGDLLTEVGQSCSCAQPDRWGEVPVGVPLAVTLSEQRVILAPEVDR